MIISLIIGVCFSGCMSMKESGFHRPVYCPNSIPNFSAAFTIYRTRSVLECLARCSSDTKCVSISFVQINRDCRLNDKILKEDCSNGLATTSGKYYEKKSVCFNGEVYLNGDCACVGGFKGPKCESTITDCTDGYNEGYRNSQIDFYKIKPTGASAPTTVQCVMTFGGRTVVLRHYHQSFSFHRSWQEYKEGFRQTDNHDYWIGLDTLYVLTNSKAFTLVIEFEKTPGDYYVMKAENFRIGNEASGYKIERADYKYQHGNDLGDCISTLIGQKFATYDRDVFTLCSSIFQIGWWFNIGSVCSHCNPSGTLSATGGTMRLLNPRETFSPTYFWIPKGVTIWLEV